MTHHVAYTLQFEQAMQLVDPSVSIPYWEYTIEREKAWTVAFIPYWDPLRRWRRITMITKTKMTASN